MTTKRRRVVILGAAGRDFHNFNVRYRDDATTEVVAFTATQIPGIAGRRYPPALAGDLYPDGIPIFDEADLESLCRERAVDAAVFSYSDVPYPQVLHVGSRALAAGADFELLSPAHTWVKAAVPTVAVCAVRTGCGKSQTTRWMAERLRERGLRVAVVRHPMPYGDLERQAVQRFERPEDLTAADCTLEEREEYEQHLAAGNVVYAGVDYQRIIARASAECDVLLWDGGNNDAPFVEPDLLLVLVDPLRIGHEGTHHPGEVVLRMADAVIVAKADAAGPERVEREIASVRTIRPTVPIFRAASPITLDPLTDLAGRRVLVIEDGPTITHGGMPHGAGFVAATAAGAEIVDPRNSATPEIAAVFRQYPHIGPVLPAMGYDAHQLRELERTIAGSTAEIVVAGTPTDIASLLTLVQPVVRARYSFAEFGEPRLSDWLAETFLDRLARQAAVDLESC